MRYAWTELPEQLKDVIRNASAGDTPGWHAVRTRGRGHLSGMVAVVLLGSGSAMLTGVWETEQLVLASVLMFSGSWVLAHWLRRVRAPAPALILGGGHLIDVGKPEVGVFVHRLRRASRLNRDGRHLWVKTESGDETSIYPSRFRMKRVLGWLNERQTEPNLLPASAIDLETELKHEQIRAASASRYRMHTLVFGLAIGVAACAVAIPVAARLTEAAYWRDATTRPAERFSRESANLLRYERWTETVQWSPGNTILLQATRASEHLLALDSLMDHALFREAVEDESVRLLRAYLARYRGSARHEDEAVAEIRSLYQRAAEKFGRLARESGIGTEAIATVQALLLQLATPDDPAVPLVFGPSTDLDGDPLEARIRRATRATVVDVDPSFTAEKNERRAGAAVNRIGSAFDRVFGMYLSIAWRSEVQTEPRLAVSYQVVGGPGFYTLQSERDWPLAQRTLYVPVRLLFDVELIVPGAIPHRFRFVAEPAPDFSVPAGTAVYDKMVDTAFADIAGEVIAVYGLSLIDQVNVATR